MEERMKVIEEWIEEKASGEKVRKRGDRIEKDRVNREGKTKILIERIQKLEERLEEEVQKTEKEDMERQKIIDSVEANVTKDTKERQDRERKKEEYLTMHAVNEPRKDMETKMEEQMKILNLVLEAVQRQEHVGGGGDREDKGKGCST
jgi:seryl-tRNA synthetase